MWQWEKVRPFARPDSARPREAACRSAVRVGVSPPVIPLKRPKGQRNRGAFLLGRVGLPDAEIAARIGCSRSQVTNYRACKLKPRRGNRVGLKREFGIPEDSWDRVSRSDLPPAAPAVQLLSGPIGPEDLQRLVTQLVTSVYAPGSQATPYEQAKVMRSATAMLVLLGKLTGDTLSLTEAKILRLPAWQRLKSRILGALRPWPDAIRAVGKALEDDDPRP
jgi:hypothetical protein